MRISQTKIEAQMAATGQDALVAYRAIQSREIAMAKLREARANRYRNRSL